MEYGRRFYKLSGSGNDFVAFDELTDRTPRSPPAADEIRALCRRGTGIGADGVMVLRPASDADYELVYYNADGSRAELCGNASLCSVRLALELGFARADGTVFVTDAGRITGRVRDGLPEVDLSPAEELAAARPDLEGEGLPAGEQRLGYAKVGVPHVVILCTDAQAADVERRGPELRHHRALADGANVNFVSGDAGRWAIRTFERGVEAETLACGTGSVATALLLAEWAGSAAAEESGGGGTARVHGTLPQERATELTTRSGLVHRVTLRRARVEDRWRPSLAGSARIVFRGELGEP